MEREMTMNSKTVVFAALLLAWASTLAAQHYPAQVATPSNDSGTAKQVAKPQGEGERAFEQHCSRCHTAPDGFSSRISGTVARHMRVRASLSEHEEKELLHFLNP
jgi:cytochrome c5